MFKNLRQRERPLDNFDRKVTKLVCNKCGLVIDDSEPMGYPEFYHKTNTKRYCPNQGTFVGLGTAGIGEFRRKSERRARNRGARKAGKQFRNSK